MPNGQYPDGGYPVNRTEASRALAKTLAYLACGKREDASKWFRQLTFLLGFSDLMKEGK